MPLETLQNGRYRILRTLGSGSMGEVYLVDDTRINRQVAIKVIRTEATPYPDDTTSQDAARLFEREAKAIAKLNHPHILPLYDFGEEVVNGTPLAYMVMPYCPEGSLSSWLKQRGTTPLSPQEVMHFLGQAADALQHAHDNDIIHQDVKPQNFLIRGNKNADLPDLLLADFGIAKLTVGTSGASQAIRGTPIYMAPEQWEGHPVPASDQYALAVMIYQLLTGRPPFQGGPGQMMYQHFNLVPQPPSALHPGINADVDAVLLRALAKRPADRFPSMSAFSNAFRQALQFDTPTIANTRSRAGVENIRVTLAISPEEALHGTSRTLTLAGGRRVTVAIPAGAQNGNIIRTAARDSNEPDATIPMLLTIAVTSVRDNAPTSIFNDEQTFAGGLAAVLPDTGRTSIANNPTITPVDNQATISGQPTIFTNNDAPTSSNIVLPPPIYNAPVYNRNPAPPPQLPYESAAATTARTQRRRFSPVLATLLIGLALLLIIGSVALVFYYMAVSNSGIANSNATATAFANNNSATSQSNDAATAQANANATTQAQSNATATANAQNNANANATATADAQNNANATATANAQTNAANATATANANANVTATAQAATATATATASTVPFKVQSISISVNPTSISGMACGTHITVTYTATFVVPANTAGGTVQFIYSTNNGRSQQDGTVTFAAGETTKTFPFTWTGNLPADHTYPGAGIVVTSTPNQVTSPAVAPDGQCS